MNLLEVEERLTQLETEVREMTEVEAVEKATEEKKELLERKAELDALEERKAQAEAIENNEVEVNIIESRSTEIKKENTNMEFTRESKEYRDAFFANLVGNATVEQRAIFADNTSAGDGLALPVATDAAIWDQILTQHPILADVSLVKSGIVMKVTQMTPNNLGTTSGVKAKKDSDALVELAFTGKDIVLAGKDYATYVTLSYAEAKMSQGAMEAFLVNEIANALGELVAKDVFAQILTDATANSVTKTGTYFEAIGEALGKATQATNPVIYAPSSLYYAILKEVDSNGQPIVRDGVVLGATLKKDNAATKVTVVDPSMFVLNIVSDIAIKSQDDVKSAAYVIGGYCREEGCLRKVNAGAFIA